MLLINQGEVHRGIAIVEEAVAKCPSLIFFVNDTLVIHYLRESDTAKLKELLKLRAQQSERIAQLDDLGTTEPGQLTSFKPDAATAKHLLGEFKKIAVIERAYCVQKDIEDGSSAKLKFVVLEQCSGISFRLSRSLNEDFLDTLEFECEFEFKVIVKRKSFCREYLMPIPGALFYDRKNS